jgi:hypothetical protein
MRVAALRTGMFSGVLVAVLMAAGALPLLAADQPATQKQQSNDRVRKGKPQDKPPAPQRRTPVPET